MRRDDGRCLPFVYDHGLIGVARSCICHARIVAAGAEVYVHFIAAKCVSFVQDGEAFACIALVRNPTDVLMRATRWISRLKLDWNHSHEPRIRIWFAAFRLAAAISASSRRPERVGYSAAG